MNELTQAVLQAREKLEKLTPLKGNCGRYCGAACCEADESGLNGMLLLPGEDELYEEESEDFPFSLEADDTLLEGGYRLVCEGTCRRDRRPLACRIFPLRIRIEGENVRAEIDPRAWAVCPLPERGGLRAMDPAFIAAVEEAGRTLIAQPEIRQALLREQKTIDESRQL